MSTKRLKKKEIIFLAVVSIIFLISSMYKYQLPGLDFDSARESFSTANLLTNSPYTGHVKLYFTIFGKIFPIMVVPQSGAVYTYAMLPFFYFLGINVFSFRLAASVFMVLSFIVFYYLCKDLFGRRFAIIASLLYIFDSTIFFLNRYRAQDSLLLLIMILVTFFFYRFYLTKRNKYLYISSFFAGLGLSLFILFLRFLIPFLIVILIFYFAMLAKKKIKFVFNIRKYLITIGLFCAGAFMFIIYNIITKGTIKLIYNNLINPTSFGVNNLDFFHNLKISISNILYLKNFAYPEQSPLIFFTPGPLLSPHISILLLISIAFLVVLLFFIKPKERIKISFLLTLLPFFILIGNFTTSTFADFDYIIYVPIFMVIITTALYFGFRSLFNLFKMSKSRKKGYAFLSLVLLLLIILGVNSWMFYREFVNLEKTGGIYLSSDAIYGLTDYMLERDITPVTSEIKFLYNIPIISEGKLYPTIFCHRESKENFSIKLQPYLHEDTYMLYFARYYDEYPHEFDYVNETVDEAGYVLEIDKSFYMRNGTLVYNLYRISKTN